MAASCHCPGSMGRRWGFTDGAPSHARRIPTSRELSVRSSSDNRAPLPERQVSRRLTKVGRYPDLDPVVVGERIMPGALEGLRVLDFTTTIAGPHCGRMLADLGADVVKIEAPEGDMMRTRPPLRAGASTSFGQLNAGKKSVVLDLKSPRAVEAARRLVAAADVVVENFRPGVMRRFGLDYPAMKEIKPDIVYCAISGYGQTGPSAELPAYAPVIHAASGYDLAQIAHQEEARRPDYCGIFIADVLTGTYAFGAITAALYRRQLTGEGQLIDVSMLESMLTLTLSEIQAAQFPVTPPGRPIFGPIATKNGYIMLAVASERTFQNLAAASGHPSWVDDPRFAQYSNRRRHWGELVDELEAWSKTLTTPQVQAIFDRHGVPSSPYRTVKEAMADPQLAHRQALAEIIDAGGSFLALNPPFRFSAAVACAKPFAAVLGEHTEEVLSEIGYTAAEIAALRN
jgi:crotonobetainyl-CoA:carnitine CoA-transferase CaiB-like acyl-CoA transferase